MNDDDNDIIYKNKEVPYTYTDFIRTGKDSTDPTENCSRLQPQLYVWVVSTQKRCE